MKLKIHFLFAGLLLLLCRPAAFGQVLKRTGIILDSLTTTELNNLPASAKLPGSIFYDRTKGNHVTWSNLTDDWEDFGVGGLSDGNYGAFTVTGGVATINAGEVDAAQLADNAVRDNHLLNFTAVTPLSFNVTVNENPVTVGAVPVVSSNTDFTWTNPNSIVTNDVELTGNQTIAGVKTFTSRIEQTTLGNSTFFGENAGESDDGTSNGNTAFGTNALMDVTTGTNNVAIGFAAAPQSTTSGGNTAVGSQTLGASAASAQTGGNNTAVGFLSLAELISGSNNTAIGVDALRALTTGGSNVAIGVNAGELAIDDVTENTTGQQGVYVGYNTQPSANGNTNEIIIGYNAQGNGSNTATIGNSNTTALYVGSNQVATAANLGNVGGITATGFDGVLTTTDDTVQEVAQALDDLSDTEIASAYTPTNYTRASATVRGQLQGIDAALGSVGSGSGDVVGPVSATNNGVALFDGTTGKLLKSPSVGTGLFTYDGSTIVMQSTGSADLLQIKNSAGSNTIRVSSVGDLVGWSRTYNSYIDLYADLTLASARQFRWSATSSPTATADTGLERYAAGVVGITDGSSGEGDLYLNDLTASGDLQVNGGNIGSTTSLDINLDTDNNGAEAFNIVDGAGTTVFSVSEAGAMTIPDGAIEAADLKATNSPTDGYFPSYDSGTGGVTWEAVSGVSDGDKGDITVTSGVWNIDASTVGSSEIIDASIDETDLDASTNASLDLADGSVQKTISGRTGTSPSGLLIQTAAQITTDGTPGATEVVICSDCSPAEVVTSATIAMDGWKMYDDQTADAATITLSDCDPGETLTVYINRASAPALAGAGLTFNQLPNTTPFASATQMMIIFEVAYDGTTIDYYYVER